MLTSCFDVVDEEVNVYLNWKLVEGGSEHFSNWIKEGAEVEVSNATVGPDIYSHPYSIP